MHRTQVLLEEEQVRRLREEAARRGLSMAEIIREALEEHLAKARARGSDKGPKVREREELRRRALAVVGRFSSGSHDIAEEHDRELEEAYRG